MGPKQEAHCNNLQAHFNRVNHKEYVIRVVLVVPRYVLGVIESKEDGVHNNG